MGSLMGDLMAKRLSDGMVVPKESGFKHDIRYQHRYVPLVGIDGLIYAHGRITVAVEPTTDPEYWTAAVAWCRPGEQFSRARGRAIAAGAIRHGRYRLVGLRCDARREGEDARAHLARVFQAAVETVWRSALRPSWAPKEVPDAVWVPPGVRSRVPA